MKKSIRDKFVLIPSDIEELFSKPPVVRTDTKAYNALFQALVKSLEAKDPIELIFIDDMAYYRTQIQRLRRIESAFAEIACSRNTDKRIELTEHEADAYFDEVVKGADLTYEEKTKGIDSTDPKLARVRKKHLSHIQAQEDKIERQQKRVVKKLQQECFSDEHQAALFLNWIDQSDRIEQMIFSFEKRYRDTLRDFSEYRSGLGKRLREADMKVVEAVFDAEEQKTWSVQGEPLPMVENGPGLMPQDQSESPVQSSAPGSAGPLPPSDANSILPGTAAPPHASETSADNSQASAKGAESSPKPDQGECT